MASVVNFANRNLMSRIFVTRHKPVCTRLVTTGRRNYKSATEPTDDKIKFEHIPDFSKPDETKNWVSYGFDYENPLHDKFKMHTHYFLAILTMVWAGFFFMYMPDYEHQNWARREAYIRLHEREKLGLDPIDKNYVDPEKIVLPSDEELGDFEIII